MLAFPLKYYDEEGRLLPPLLLLICCLYLCRGWLLFALSFIDSGQLLFIIQMIQPSRMLLLSSLVIGGMSLLIILCVAYRQFLRAGVKRYWVVLMRPIVVFLLLTDLALLVDYGSQIHWRFDGAIASQLLLTLYFLLWSVRSRHLSAIQKNWLG